jgi:hypothetical protein
MADESTLALEYQPPKGKGKGTVTARLPGADSYTDRVDLGDAEDQARFLKALCKGRRGVAKMKKAVAAELERLAGEVAAKSGESGGRRSQADVLLALAVGAELFHAPGNGDCEAFATFSISGHKETWPIKSKGFRSWLARLYHLETGRAANAQALQDALGALAGKAMFDGPEFPFALRVAEHQGAIYLDLADAAWRAIEITAGGWRIVAEPPVRFIRRRGMLALPEAARGGSVQELRPLVNLPQDEAWTLFVAWLVNALRSGRPFPILAVNGEQGSAKSTLCRMARALLDPNAAPLRRPPRDDRDLMIAANNGWCVALDNLSGISPALSDSLCALATGGGFGTRELYTDDEEKLFDATRPIMLNGIEDVATRPDLLDRAICLTLTTIPDAARRDECALWTEFEEVRPRVLGALLDAAATALRKLPTTRLPSKPRMADFALWVTAAEPALPWKPGTFLTAYTGNRGAANELAMEASIIGGPILSLAAAVQHWVGTARDLLDALEAGHASDKIKKHKDWPAGPRKLSGEVRRLAPNLRRAGVEATFGREPGWQRRRIIRLERTANQPALPSQSSQGPETAGEMEGRSRDGKQPNGVVDRPSDRAANPGRWDGRDGGDGYPPPQSACSGTEEEMMEWTG